MNTAAVLCTLGLIAVFSPDVARCQRPGTEQLRAEVQSQVASLQKLSQEIVDMVFSFSEPGFEERRTAAYLAGVLEREGFRIQRGCAGMPTCYVASWGSGKPIIGIMGDIDALPETSQKPGIPWEEPLVRGAPGHGEGHNSAPAVDLVAAIAVKRVMDKYKLPGQLRVIPGVAEELLASRTHMVNAGLFRDMDVMLATHIDTDMKTTYGLQNSGLISTTFTFRGVSAHSSVSPWLGRSALDAVELMNVAWNYRREHLRPQHKSHYVVVNGGSQPNVVPSEATVWYYFRELDYPHLRELHELGRKIARAAADMTDTQVSERMYGAAWPASYNKPLAEAMHENILRVGMPPWSADDQAFAKAAQAMRNVKQPAGLPVTIATELREAEQAAGSDDIAEVTWNVPTVRLRYPGQIPGMTGHHWSSAISMATPIAHKGANYGARVLAMTAMDIVTTPALQSRAWQYFREVTTRDYRWSSLMPKDVAPPISINETTMAKYRPELERLVYDPSRFGTYLDQLGIPYPTIRKP